MSEESRVRGQVPRVRGQVPEPSIYKFFYLTRPLLLGEAPQSLLKKIEILKD